MKTDDQQVLRAIIVDDEDLARKRFSHAPQGIQ